MSKFVIRHTVYNAAGLVTPILAALLSIPILIHHLGSERFGVLTLVWAVVNYFGIFDLGLGRALTLQLAALLSRKGEVDELLRTTLAALFVLGLTGGAAMLALASMFSGQISSDIEVHEIVGTVTAIAVAMPFIVLTSGARGALEARSAFGILNLIRIPMSIVNFVLPVAIAVYGSGRLDDIAWSLTFARAIGFIIHAYFVVCLYPTMLSSKSMQLSWLKSLLTTGGWMTVSNIIGPLMGYLDRFIVGFLISATFVAYYATPQELILKVYLVPGALTSVLFPAFAGDHANSASLYRKSLFGMAVIILPACALAFFGSHYILSLWVNEAFADQSYRVMQILVLGMVVGAMSSIPYTYLQAIGRSNLTAISHVAQLPLFLVGSFLLTSKWGIEGAAVAWSVRLAIDAIVLFAAAQAISPKENL